MKNLTILALLLLTGCSDFILCGWDHVDTRQLAEAPTGRCWLLVTPPDMATSLADSGTNACHIEPGDHTYQGGAFVDFWGKGNLSGDVTHDMRVEGVDCPEP